MIVPALALALALVLAFVVVGCARADPIQGDPWAKITFDLSELDEAGLRGPPDGLRAVSYEFCIPDNPEHEEEVSVIDLTAECTSGSAGRIGCGEGERLCIGSTHQEGFRSVLGKLAELRYVERIDEAFFE